MRQQASVEIDRPIGEVFEYTNNHVADWSLTVVEEQKIHEEPGGTGSTFRCITEEQGRRMEFEGRVTRYEPPNFAAVHLTGTAFDIDVEYLFDDLGDRTRVTQRSSVSPKGGLKLFFLLFGWMIKRAGCRAAERELANLKRKLEERSPPEARGSTSGAAQLY